MEFKRKNKRRQEGMLAESMGALSLFVPLALMMTSLLVMTSQSFELSKHLNRGANAAARAIAQEYRTNPDITYDKTRLQAVFTRVRIPNVIASNEQFAIPSDGWQLKTSPPTVTVVVTYLSGKGEPALPVFPVFDPLNLMRGASIKSSATYRLQ